MLYERLTLPTTGGAEITVDTYSPAVKQDDDRTQLRTGIVVCGGGAYAFVSDRETEPVALRFAAMGFNTYVVKYRVAPNRFPCAVQDIACAVAYVREHAARYQQHPDRIAVLGFSAGGHAAGSLGVMWPHAKLWAPLDRTPDQVRPNAMVLCYPVINAGPCAHRWSFENLTGSADLAEHAKYSLDEQVTADTPPTFLWTTWDDEAVPSQNTLLMATALRAHDVPAEVHIYPHGVHGLSLGEAHTACAQDRMIEPDVTGWPDLAAKFLRRMLEK